MHDRDSVPSESTGLEVTVNILFYAGEPETPSWTPFPTPEFDMLPRVPWQAVFQETAEFGEVDVVNVEMCEHGAVTVYTSGGWYFILGKEDWEKICNPTKLACAESGHDREY